MHGWARRGLLAFVLLPLALIFSVLVALRRSLFRFGILTTETLPVPVIVVGNITVGGVGKTPLTMHLVEELRRHGRVPGVISRGYGRDSASALPMLIDDTSEACQVGDEPLLVYRRTRAPVVVSRDRVAAARALLAAHPDVDILISDDGLQHYRLPRAFEIAVFDERGVMNGWMLPAGPLREPVGRLREVNAVVVNSNAVSASEHLRPGGIAVTTGDAVSPGLTFAVSSYRMNIVADEFYRLGAPGQRVRADHFAGRAVNALAGIGNPQRFFFQLVAMGIAISAYPFPDHHDYQRNDLPRDGKPILTTEKDAVKLQDLLGEAGGPVGLPEIWVLPVSCRLEPDLVSRILEKI